MTKQYRTGPKIKTSSHYVEEIQNKANDKGWNSDNPPEVEATKYLFLQEINQFVELTSRNETVIPCKKLTTRLIRSIFNRFSIDTVCQFVEDSKRNEISYIDIQEIIDLIENEGCKAYGVSRKSWNDFRTATKEIDKKVFTAYCHILGIIDWESVADLPPIYQEKKRNEKKFVDALSFFNHYPQINILSESLTSQKRVFLVSNECLYSTNWMLRRIQKALTTTSQQETQFISIKTSRNSPKPINRVFEETVYTELTKLTSNNLGFIINIEDYDLERIESLIKKSWQSVCERESSSSGYTLLFLIDNNKSNKWEMLQENEELRNKVVLLNNANPFNLDHVQPLQETILNTRVATRKSLKSGDNLCKISEDIINRAGKNTLNLLQRLYYEFDITDAELNQTWTIYP